MSVPLRCAVTKLTGDCWSHKNAKVRAVQFRTLIFNTEASQNLQTRDSGIAASFYKAIDNAFDPVQSTWYGIVQDIYNVLMPFSEPELFFRVKWYAGSIAFTSEPHAPENVVRIKCAGNSADYSQQGDVFFRPNNFDHQVFYCKVPGQFTNPPNHPWLWVWREVTSSLTVGDHLLDDEGMII